MKYPKSLQTLIDSFQLLPGIGSKSAERLAMFVVNKLDEKKVHDFSNALLDAKTKIKKCPNCGMITDNEKCDICIDSERENSIIVVESAKDVLNFEKLGIHKGKYHVLNGLISPLNGIGIEDININSLILRVEDEHPTEVIIATSATIEGEITSKYIANILKDKGVLVSRIGYGLPAGADIEYADEITLYRALESRKKME